MTIRAPTHVLRIKRQDEPSIVREIEFPSDRKLVNLAQGIVRAFHFDFDHAFGFYSAHPEFGGGARAPLTCQRSTHTQDWSLSVPSPSQRRLLRPEFNRRASNYKNRPKRERHKAHSKSSARCTGGMRA